MIHALLRLALLAVNVLDTFKILKPPKPHKGSVLASARALTARKRAMKGMLAVWVVCACWIFLEGICDRTVVFLMPFYNEVKTMSLLFLIFSRATGAEPILLKLLRPMIKPHAQQIDAVLDLLGMVTAFSIELAAVPVQKLHQRWDDFSTSIATAEAGSRTREVADDAVMKRSRRITVFSFWRDDKDKEDQAPDGVSLLPHAADMGSTSSPPAQDVHLPRPQNRSSGSSSSEGPPRMQRPRANPTPENKPLPTMPPKEKPTFAPRTKTATRPSNRQPCNGLPPNIDHERAVEAVRQAREVYGEIEDAQETVRDRVRVRKGVDRPPTVESTQHHQDGFRSDGSTARLILGRPKGGVEPLSQPPVPFPSAQTSQPRPQAQSSTQHAAYPSLDPTIQTSLPYVPAPPSEAFSPTHSLEVQRPLPMATPLASQHVTVPPGGSNGSNAPPLTASSTAQNPLADLDIDAYFSPAGRKESDAKVLRRRPEPLQSERLASRANVHVELTETVPLTPAQFLATPPKPSGSALTTGRTPMAPGGFGWEEAASPRVPPSDAMGADDEDEDDELGPDDSVSVRGAPPPFYPLRAGAPVGQKQGPGMQKKPSDLNTKEAETRPSTVYDFELLRKQMEEEEEEEEEESVAAVPRLPANLPGHFPMSPGMPPQRTMDMETVVRAPTSGKQVADLIAETAKRAPSPDEDEDEDDDEDDDGDGDETTTADTAELRKVIQDALGGKNLLPTPGVASRPAPRQPSKPPVTGPAPAAHAPAQAPVQTLSRQNTIGSKRSRAQPPTSYNFAPESGPPGQSVSESFSASLTETAKGARISTPIMPVSEFGGLAGAAVFPKSTSMRTRTFPAATATATAHVRSGSGAKGTMGPPPAPGSGSSEHSSAVQSQGRAPTRSRSIVAQKRSIEKIELDEHARFFSKPNENKAGSTSSSEKKRRVGEAPAGQGDSMRARTRSTVPRVTSGSSSSEANFSRPRPKADEPPIPVPSSRRRATREEVPQVMAEPVPQARPRRQRTTPT